MSAGDDPIARAAERVARLLLGTWREAFERQGASFDEPSYRMSVANGAIAAEKVMRESLAPLVDEHAAAMAIFDKHDLFTRYSLDAGKTWIVRPLLERIELACKTCLDDEDARKNKALQARIDELEKALGGLRSLVHPKTNLKGNEEWARRWNAALDQADAALHPRKSEQSTERQWRERYAAHMMKLGGFTQEAANEYARGADYDPAESPEDCAEETMSELGR